MTINTHDNCSTYWSSISTQTLAVIIFVLLTSPPHANGKIEDQKLVMKK